MKKRISALSTAVAEGQVAIAEYRNRVLSFLDEEAENTTYNGARKVKKEAIKEETEETSDI